ncbi:Chromosome segregation protein smc [Neofusicoccum parvum]|uniref:Chromosome segregation protein smc n=1 Tax=Neofusicoccum parvum TaxID=310453 RepID=A0ACB5RW73_9PEZI|nr:Chromosome segregation protein smc [Neofusicoccum parvum]
MNGPRSPNPARNYAVCEGQGKYNMDFLLSFRNNFISPPLELNKNLQDAGVKPPATPPPTNTRPDEKISIDVTSPNGHDGEASGRTDVRAQRKEAVMFLQKRTHERMLAKEEVIKKQQKDHDEQKADLEQEWLALEQEKMAFAQKKLALEQNERAFHQRTVNFYTEANSVLESLNKRLQETRTKSDDFEKMRLETMCHTLKTRMETVQGGKTEAELQAEPVVEKRTRICTAMDRVATVAAFLDNNGGASEEDYARALAEFQVDLIALFKPISDLANTRGGRTGMLLVTGIPHVLKKEEVVCAIKVISKDMVQVHDIYPGSSSLTVTAVGYFAGCPDELFEGKRYAARDVEILSIGRIRLHLMVLDLES